MLMKAKPMIDAITSVVTNNNLQKDATDWKVFFLTPSQKTFNQQRAYEYAKLDHIVFVAGRYEGVDDRFQQYMIQHYPHNFEKISVGEFVTL